MTSATFWLVGVIVPVASYSFVLFSINRMEHVKASGDKGMVSIDTGRPVVFAQPAEPLPDGQCTHSTPYVNTARVVPVDTADGQRVAWLCVACGEQLPADTGCRCCWPGNGEGYELVTPLDGSPPYVQELAAPVSPEEFMRGGAGGR